MGLSSLNSWMSLSHPGKSLRHTSLCSKVGASGKVGDVRDVGSIPGLGRSAAGGHDNPLQYFFSFIFISWRLITIL